MNEKDIILIGGGGHCKSVIDVAEDAGYNIIGILDVKENIGKDVLGYPIIGTDDCIADCVNNAYFVITVGHIKNNNLRKNLYRQVLTSGGKFATLIAPDSHVSKHAIIEEGSVIMHKAMVNADAKIGKGCIINTFANIEHDAVIGDFCHISTGAMINGNCMVGNSTFVGSGAVLSNGVSIPEDSIIAGGSVVRKTLKTSGIYAGNPAIKYK